MTQEELEALRRDVAIVAEFEKTRNHELPGLADAEFRIAHMYAEKLLAERDKLKLDHDDWYQWIKKYSETDLGVDLNDAGDVLRALRERDGLAKVVEKLPKTADGVAVIPGTFLYHPSGKYTIAIGSIGSRAPVELFNGGYTTISDCFSTEAAARAASDQPAGSGG